jgi:hypothetical protein
MFVVSARQERLVLLVFTTRRNQKSAGLIAAFLERSRVTLHK